MGSHVPPVKKIQIIQVLRMVGATVVFLEHFFLEDFAIRGGVHFEGRLGVGIFFVLSGFLLTYTDHGNFKGYLQKKIIRICPLYWLTTLGVFVLGRIAPQMLTSDATALRLFTSLFFIPNYSGNGTTYPLNPVGWTLNIEMFVYVLYFCAAILCHWILKNKNNVYIRGIVTSALLVSLALSKYILPENIFTITYCRIYMLYFAAGMIGAMLLRKFYGNAEKIFVQSKHALLGTVVPLCLACVGIGLSLIYIETVYSALILSICVLALILVFWKERFSRLWVTIGDVSYSFYLLHYFAARLYARVIARYLPMHNDLINIAAAIVFYSLIMLVSYFCYRIFEVKLSGWMKRKFLNAA